MQAALDLKEEEEVQAFMETTMCLIIAILIWDLEAFSKGVNP